LIYLIVKDKFGSGKKYESTNPANEFYSKTQNMHNYQPNTQGYDDPADEFKEYDQAMTKFEYDELSSFNNKKIYENSSFVKAYTPLKKQS
jgi:hypothetical protein